MNQRIQNLKQNIREMCDAGIRKTYLYEYAAESLKETIGEPAQIRRAKAFAHVMERAELVVLPYELVAGSMLGMVPVIGEQMDETKQILHAREVLEAYCRKKEKNQKIDGTVQYKEGHVKSFAEEFASRKSRWSLMSRVYHDSMIEYDELQRLIQKMYEEFKDRGIEYYEIGRELERDFKIPYPQEDMELYNDLPWFIGNHLNLNYAGIIHKGLGKKREEIKELFGSEEEKEKKEYYESALITIDAVIRVIARYAGEISGAAEKETSELRKKELFKMADICRKISEEPADTFYEAVQLMWMLHIVASIQGGSALSFGRMDQYLYPFYKKDLEQGRLSEDEAKDLLCCVWLKVNEPKMRTVQSITLGGITREGENAVNELTRLCLKVTRDVAMPYPNMGLRIHPKNPEWVYEEAVLTAKSGCGQPMLLNDEIWIPNTMKLGYCREDANDYYNMGCVEIMVPGKQPSWGVLDAIAFPALIERVMDKFDRKEIRLQGYQDFMDAFFKEMDLAIEADYEEAQGKIISMKDKTYDPYSSILIDGCLENGKDMLQGGSELPMHWSVYAYGIGTAADAICAMKKFVFEEKRFSLEEMSDALKANFTGYEQMREVLVNETPAYGNGIREVDEIANEILSYFSKGVFALNQRGGAEKYVSTLFGYFFHIYHGEICGATPDGRRKGEPFSDSMGPNQGRDVKGPTRMMMSVLHLDDAHITGGYALNFKMNPSFLAEEEGKEAIVRLLQTYIENGGPQIQCYTTNVEDLADAQLHPERHRDLIVRVGGYCEFFVNLDKVLQDEIMKRTLYGEE